MAFKEPQPRGGGQKAAGAQVKPEMMARQLRTEPVTAEEFLLESARQPIMAMPDHTPFQLRKAALEAALGLGLEPNHHGALFWDNLNTFEAYLRDGTKL